jgi:Sec23-binding domain of Sec16
MLEMLLFLLFSIPFEEFANNVIAIQCTEVYEYSMSLGNPHFILPSFQLFRFLYFVRLLDYGMLEEVIQ